MNEERKKYVTTAEAAQILGVSTRTIQNYVAAGKLPTKKGERGKNLYLRENVLSLVNESEERNEISENETKEEGAKKDEHKDETSPEKPHLASILGQGKYVLVERQTYETLLKLQSEMGFRIGQLETEKRQLSEKIQLIEDKYYREEEEKWKLEEQVERFEASKPWWKRIFG